MTIRCIISIYFLKSMLLNHINIIMIIFQFNKQINIIVYS